MLISVLFIKILIQQITMSNSRIFSGTPRYEPMPQGRSANLTSAMFKRTPIFNHPSNDKQQPMSPFSNYNWKITESSFSESQTSILQQRFNPDIIKQMMKQELAKLPSTDENSRKMFQTSQAQISDLKDKMTDYEDYEKQTNQKITALTERMIDHEKQNNQKLQIIVQQLKEEILSESQKMVTAVQSQITQKFRNFFQIVNVEIKKDIIKVVSNQFLSFGYGQDLQNRLSIFNERLQAVDNLIQAKNISKPDERQKAITSELSKTYELKLSNLQKQLQTRKKEVHNLTIRMNKTQQRISENKQRKDLQQKIQIIQSLTTKMKQISQQNNKFMKSITQLQNKQITTERDVKLVQAQFNELNRSSDHHKVAINDLNQRMDERDKTQNELRHFINNNENISSSIIITNGHATLTPTKIPTFESNYIPLQTPEPQSLLPQKLVYQVDKDGHLMDGDGNYLLSDNDQMIWLSDEQLTLLLNSQEVELVDA